MPTPAWQLAEDTNGRRWSGAAGGGLGLVTPEEKASFIRWLILCLFSVCTWTCQREWNIAVILLPMSVHVWFIIFFTWVVDPVLTGETIQPPDKGNLGL